MQPCCMLANRTESEPSVQKDVCYQLTAVENVISATPSTMTEGGWWRWGVNRRSKGKYLS